MAGAVVPAEDRYEEERALPSLLVAHLFRRRCPPQVEPVRSRILERKKRMRGRSTPHRPIRAFPPAFDYLCQVGFGLRCLPPIVGLVFQVNANLRSYSRYPSDHNATNTNREYFSGFPTANDGAKCGIVLPLGAVCHLVTITFCFPCFS